MEITEAKILLRQSPDGKLKAYATVTFDGSFVVRDMKIIEGTKGLFVAMPSRKMTEACAKCNSKNPMRSKFCSSCGASLEESRQRIISASMEGERQSEHRDIAHPITQEFREYIQNKVISAYEAERAKAGESAASSLTQ